MVAQRAQEAVVAQAVAVAHVAAVQVAAVAQVAAAVAQVAAAVAQVAAAGRRPPTVPTRFVWCSARGRRLRPILTRLRS